MPALLILHAYAKHRVVYVTAVRLDKKAVQHTRPACNKHRLLKGGGHFFAPLKFEPQICHLPAVTSRLLPSRPTRLYSLCRWEPILLIFGIIVQRYLCDRLLIVLHSTCPAAAAAWRRSNHVRSRPSMSERLRLRLHDARPFRQQSKATSVGRFGCPMRPCCESLRCIAACASARVAGACILTVPFFILPKGAVIVGGEQLRLELFKIEASRQSLRQRKKGNAHQSAKSWFPTE